jgi:hypothetical protein
MRQHYTASNFDALAVIEDWGLDFVSGSIVKYLQRQDHKGQAEQDRYKVLWYAAYLVTRSREYADRVVTDAREIIDEPARTG